jgi:copper chaperone CopZ
MKTLNLEVENIKCGGCANSITKALLGINGVLAVDKVDRQSNHSFNRKR